MSIDRRDFVRGSTAAAIAVGLPWPAKGAGAPQPLFADTPLAANPVARMFQRVDLELPDAPVDTAAGPSSLAGIGGKTRLIALWAEWCVPCLVEIRDFAALRPAVATDRFDIGLVLTASAAKLDRAGALAKLRPLGAAGLLLLVEPDGGARVAQALATGGARPVPAGQRQGFTMPCTLLVDSKGRVKGRAFGAPTRSGGIARPALTDAQKAALKRGESVVRSQSISDADKDKMLAEGSTLWASPAATALLKALGDGLLDRV